MMMKVPGVKSLGGDDLSDEPNVMIMIRLVLRAMQKLGHGEPQRSASQEPAYAFLRQSTKLYRNTITFGTWAVERCSNKVGGGHLS
jgi:hypothetical protein